MTIGGGRPAPGLPPAGSTRRPHRSLVAQAAAVALLVTAAGCGSARTATGSGAAPSGGAASTLPLGERPAPSFLPTSSGADTALVATPDHPALAFQGETVVVHVGRATVQATVVGPGVPHQGGPILPSDVTCTWTVTLSGSGASIPVGVEQWRVRDSRGRTAGPHIAAGTAAPPAVLASGQTVRFRISAVEPVGEGLVQWAPDQSSPEASWDYIAEVD